MQQVELIIWDEALMTQKYTFEALDKTLREILGYPVPDKQNKIFGGMTVLLGGDFKQILPVIPKGKRSDIVQACINRSELWKHCKVLAVGDGKVPTRIKDGEYEPTWIEIPETFHIPSSESPIQQIVEETYSNFIQRQKDDAYLRERAILTP
nr:ATP-dependent DNA helicase PIF7-like [Tanacetum cinerariifolium]